MFSGEGLPIKGKSGEQDIFREIEKDYGRARGVNGIFFREIEKEGGSKDSGQEQMISIGGRFKSAFAKRDMKQTIKDLREIS